MKKPIRKIVMLFLIGLFEISEVNTIMQPSVKAATESVRKSDCLMDFSANVKLRKNVRLSKIVPKEILTKCDLKPVYVTKKGIVSCIMESNVADSIIKGIKKGKTILYFAEKGKSIFGQKYCKVLFSVTVNVK